VSDPSAPTLVLVHGAGHTSVVWRTVQVHLRHPSLAVDLPGRRDRPGDLTTVTIDHAARSIAHDVSDATQGRVVLVGHSVAGIVLPALAARLGRRVDHLVFVAGLCAPHGGAVVDTVRPGQRDGAAARLAELRVRYRGHRLAADGFDDTTPTVDDPQLAVGIESLNFMSQAISWDGVAPTLDRTFVRCLRDPIQSRDLQARLIANCGASSVVDIDSGHTPALDAPAELAAILDRVAAAYGDTTAPMRARDALRPR
jgi:pimeloyl-ACP methyl ester carboxylesterase